MDLLGNIFKKIGNSAKWVTIENPLYKIPEDGINGQYLQFSGSKPIWKTINEFVKKPTNENGKDGQYLRKTNYGTEWANIDTTGHKVPENGKNGQYLKMGNDLPYWSDADELRLPKNGKNGQYLKKTDTGVVWSNVDIPTAINRGGIIGCLCKREPDVKIEGMLWILGGTDTPQYYHTTSFPEVYEGSFPSMVNDFSILIK